MKVNASRRSRPHARGLSQAAVVSLPCAYAPASGAAASVPCCSCEASRPKNDLIFKELCHERLSGRCRSGHGHASQRPRRHNTLHPLPAMIVMALIAILGMIRGDVSLLKRDTSPLIIPEQQCPPFRVLHITAITRNVPYAISCRNQKVIQSCPV